MRIAFASIAAAVLSVWWVLAPGPAVAEDLIQIYDLAVRSDPVLREAEQNLFATREVKPQARALLLPNISATGEVDYQDVSSRGNDHLRKFRP